MGLNTNKNHIKQAILFYFIRLSSVLYASFIPVL